jgi:hypothetical protein
MKIEKLDLSVPLLAGVSCLVTTVGLPVWALFIGWAWFFALSASKAPFTQAIPPLLAGSVLAMAAIAVIDRLLAAGLGLLPAMIIAVIGSVFLLMMTLKIPGFGASLVSFNAYSCMFAGYYAGNFPTQENYFLNFCTAFLWIAGANFLGLIFGWASIKLTTSGRRTG